MGIGKLNSFNNSPKFKFNSRIDNNKICHTDKLLNREYLLKEGSGKLYNYNNGFVCQKKNKTIGNQSRLNHPKNVSPGPIY